jgi:hypothetical protein
LALALILLGPFLPLKPSRSLICGSLALVGFCSALLMVASFLRANRTAINEGFQDDINTYIFISGYSTFSEHNLSFQHVNTHFQDFMYPRYELGINSSQCFLNTFCKMRRTVLSLLIKHSKYNFFHKQACGLLPTS